MLELARRGLCRLTAHEAQAAMQAGAVLVDTRTDEQRQTQGVIEGARHHPLSVLEWRLDPDSPNRDPEIALDDRVVLLCAEGYSSSLAAARLQAIGFGDATDVIDGVLGWRAAGLPMRSA
jgi:rhodanese-related sulfurtransferase